MKVSVAMATYQHERFLAQAIESVLMQETIFEFELVIGEDCSPDKTREVARSYAERYPGKVRLLLQEKNVGLTRNLSETVTACTGQYVGWLEGDDYWTSPHKLQRQADFLDANPDCAWCFTRADVVDIDGTVLDVPPAVRVVKPKYNLEEYLRRIFQPRACTVMFRHRLFDRFPEWFYPLPTADMPLHVMNAQHGDIGFVDEVMAAYRIHPGGVWSMGFRPEEWSGETREQKLRRAARMESLIGLYKAIDGYLGKPYRALMRGQIAGFAETQARLYGALGDRRAMQKSCLVALWAQESWRGRVDALRKLLSARAQKAP
jgi:glycosyltransferase involved in cell wall biosynthesis